MYNGNLFGGCFVLPAPVLQHRLISLYNIEIQQASHYTVCILTLGFTNHSNITLFSLAEASEPTRCQIQSGFWQARFVSISATRRNQYRWNAVLSRHAPNRWILALKIWLGKGGLSLYLGQSALMSVFVSLECSSFGFLGIGFALFSRSMMVPPGQRTATGILRNMS